MKNSEKPVKKKKKKIAKPLSKKQLYILIGACSAVFLALLVSIVFVFVGGSRKASSKNQDEQQNSVSTALNAADDMTLTQEQMDAARERAGVQESLINAWKDTWLKEIDISGDCSDVASINSCLIGDSSVVSVSGVISGIPKGDTEEIYLFALSNSETSIPGGATPIDSTRLEKTEPTFTMYADLNNRSASSRLFKKFVIAAKLNGEYKILSRGHYITNPEKVAKYNAYKTTSSKKGLIVNALRMGELDDLGIKQAAYNIPLANICGGTTLGIYPTIYYDYGGKTYAFNGHAIASYDIIFRTLSSKGIQITAVLLNNNNGAYPELIHPSARGSGSAPYYMFNGSGEDGINAMAAAASFLANRYSGSGNGLVSNWVVANEINARKEWNNYSNVDVNTYTEEYAKGFRVMYNAIKSINAGANVYMPLDQQWNRNLSNGDYDARDVIDIFGTYIKSRGDIDWGLAYHPYPVPLTNAKFWDTGANFRKYTTNSVDTPMINMQNIHIVTNYMTQANLLDTKGNVRSIILSEQGFTSSSGGEAVQAAAVAYAYYIAEANQHIDAFILSRQTDDPGEAGEGLALGIENSGGGHKQAYNVYKHIDMPDSKSVSEFAKSIIGIGDWSEVIHNY